MRVTIRTSPPHLVEMNQGGELRGRLLLGRGDALAITVTLALRGRRAGRLGSRGMRAEAGGRGRRREAAAERRGRLTLLAGSSRRRRERETRERRFPFLTRRRRRAEATKGRHDNKGPARSETHILRLRNTHIETAALGGTQPKGSQGQAADGDRGAPVLTGNGRVFCLRTHER